MSNLTSSLIVGNRNQRKDVGSLDRASLEQKDYNPIILWFSTAQEQLMCSESIVFGELKES